MSLIKIVTKVIVLAVLQMVALGAYSQVVLHGLEEYKGDFELFDVKYKALRTSTLKLKSEIQKAGYLAVSIDSIVRNDSLNQADVYFYLGDYYELSELRFGTEIQDALEESGKLNLLMGRKVLSLPSIVRIINETIDYYENCGYPFVELRFDSLEWNQEVLNGVLNVDHGSKVYISEINIVGSTKLDNQLIQQMIGIRIGDPFSQANMVEIDKILKSYPYLKQVKGSEFEFVNNECKLYLYLDDQNANFFNAILGLLPDNNGKINITGDAKIKLINTFGKGELMALNWRKLLPLTQNLELQFNYPFLLKSPLGVDAKFDLYKKDTSYLDVYFQLGVQYKLTSRLTVGAYFKNKSSSLLSTEKYQFVSVLPEFADVHTNEYGLKGQWNNLDFVYNPSRGWELSLEATIGDKRIKKNISLKEELYEGLNLRSTQLFLNGTINRYVKIYRKNILKFGIAGGWLANENIFLNELFRLGGLRTIRGFDEESIFASGFGLGTIEYRFLFEEFSNLFIFGQILYYDQQVKNEYSHDLPKSFGFGMNFQTKPGIFSISYSLGSQQGNPFLFRTAKIHFGFVNYF
ncbi:MAG: BamA/TamA family outer membrane protein [Flavobacteriales bacterium]|nr:BamA/TamA family outer membrane protein [Flavobacteriales bacterium]